MMELVPICMRYSNFTIFSFELNSRSINVPLEGIEIVFQRLHPFFDGQIRDVFLEIPCHEVAALCKDHVEKPF